MRNASMYSEWCRNSSLVKPKKSSLALYEMPLRILDGGAAQAYLSLKVFPGCFPYLYVGPGPTLYGMPLGIPNGDAADA